LRNSLNKEFGVEIMNVQIIIPPKGSGVSFREIGAKICDALKGGRVEVKLDSWDKPFIPNVKVGSPLEFATWDLLIFVMTVAPGASTLFSFYSSPLMSKRAFYYGPVEGHPVLSEVQRGFLSGKVVVPSRFCEEMLEEVGIKVIGVVPHGIALDEFVFNGAKVKGWVDRFRGRTILYYLTNATSRKGVPALLEAMKIVKMKIKDVLLVLDVIPEAVRAIKAEAKKRGVEGAVFVEGKFGKMSREEIVTKLFGCDLYVNASYAEGFGLTLLEAMASMKPPITCDFPPVNEFVDEGCGFLFPHQSIRWEMYLNFMKFKNHIYNPKDLAETIIYALENPSLLIEKGHKAYEKALNYDYKKVYKKFFDLL